MSLLEQTRETGRLGLWILAARPRTLTISVAPILAAAAHAYATGGRIAALPVLAALVASIAIQIATNLFNDAADGERGHDGPARLGPPRVTGLGLIDAGEVKRAALVACLVAAGAGLFAIHAGGWPILVIGATSLVAGWAYSNGPMPISMTPLGEIFVILFFGVAAVCGTTHLASPGAVSPMTLTLGVAIGGPAAAVLLVNNHRDRAQDRRNGRRTLAILLGEAGSRAVYAALLAGSVALAAIPARAAGGAAGAGLVLLALVPAAWLSLRGYRTPVGRGLNALLGRTALFQLLLAALFALAVLGGRVLP